MAAYSQDLYGPNRLTKYAAMKEFNTRDNVLQKGDYNLTGSNWETHYQSMLKDSFQKHRSVAEQKKSSPKIKKHGINEPINDKIISYNSGRFYDQTSRDYGNHRNRGSPISKNIDREIHIVDFSPKYNPNGSTMKSSVYKSTFNDFNNIADNALTNSETAARTKDVRLTHFSLGACKDRISTETKDSFNDGLISERQSNESKTVQNSNETNLHESNIFKNGDWNSTNRSVAKTTVTTESYRDRKNATETSLRSCTGAPNEAKYDVPDYKRTHINFGSDKRLVSSFYKKDFLVAERNITQKPEIARAPPSSMILQCSNSPVNRESSIKSDYRPLEQQMSLQDRTFALEKNKKRNIANHIPLSRSDERIVAKKLTTITKNDYYKPPSDALMLHHERAPVSKYRYLDSDSALLKPRSSPTQTEFKEKYGNSSMLSKSYPPVEIRDRQKQDKSTHFAFGTDQNGRTTEQTTQFNQPLKLDPGITAAGVKDLGTSAFEKIYEKNSEDSLYSKDVNSTSTTASSIMKDDFKPLSDRNFTSPQQKLIKILEKYPPRIQPSHFFHMDNSKGRLVSTTKMNFVSPDRSGGELEQHERRFHANVT